MENTNQFTNDIAPTPKRPQFLSALCILTWICCGFLLLSALAGLFMQPSPEKQAEQLEQMRQFSPEAAEQMEAAFAEQGGAMQIVSQVLNLIAIGLSAYGAWLMWNLRKKGFYFYIAGEIIPYSGFFLAGKSAMAALSAMGGMGNAIMGVAIVVMLVFDAAFIIMYGVNLKHMNNN
jgi:hypothetical protein